MNTAFPLLGFGGGRAGPVQGESLRRGHRRVVAKSASDNQPDSDSKQILAAEKAVGDLDGVM